MQLERLHNQYEQISYQTRRTATKAAGQIAIMGYSQLGGWGITKAFSAGASTLDTVMGYLGIGFGIALNAYLINEDHKACEQQILRFYRHEIGAMQGIPAEKVTLDDLHTAGSQIPAIGESLSQNTRDRNARLAAWVGSAVLTKVVIIACAASFSTPLLMALTGGVMLFAAHKLLQPLMGKLFGVHEHRPHEMLAALDDRLQRRNHAPVTTTDLLGVLASLSPVLHENITQQMGRPYAQLSSAEQQRAVAYFQESYELQSLADDLNARRMRPQELAFIAAGRRSGLAAEAAPQEIEDAIGQALHTKWQHSREELAQATHHAREAVSNTAHHVKEAYHSHGVKGAWQALANRSGAGRKAPDQSWSDYARQPTNAPEVGRG